MALNKLKKWIGTQLFETFMAEYNENVDATNAAIDLAETHLADNTAHGLDRYGIFFGSVADVLSVPGSQHYTLPWNTILNTGDAFSLNGGILTVQSGVKAVRIWVTVSWAPNSTGYRLLAIRKDGSIYSDVNGIGLSSVPGTTVGVYDNKHFQSVSGYITVAEGDKIDILIRHNAGSSLDIGNRNTLKVEAVFE